MNKIKIIELKIDKNIVLKTITQKDAKEVFDLVIKNKKNFSKWFPWANKTKNISYTKNSIKKSLIKYKKNEVLDFCIYFDKEMVGRVGFHNIDLDNRSAVIGYWLSKDCEGRGIMTKSVEKLIEFGIKKYKLHRIKITMDTDNKKSRAIPQRLGFKYEGTEKDVSLRAGKFFSHEIWALIVK